MSDPFIGEIRMFGGTFAPMGWAMCDGQIIPIAQNDVLFSVIGVTYGGDGINTFALPDLRGRVPIHRGTNYNVGQQGGSETVSMSVQQLPNHTHQTHCYSQSSDSTTPQSCVCGVSSLNMYSATAPNANMASQSVSPAGGGQPHDNIMPYLTVTFIIALEGLYPTQN